ncbi:Protein POLR1D,isoform [Trichinella pseudospiralis]
MDSKDGDYDEKLIKRAKDALILEAKRAKERSKTMGTFGWLPPKRLTQGSRRMLGFTCVLVSEIANVPVRGTNVEPHHLVV